MGQIEQQLLQIVSDAYNATGWLGVVAMMAIESACIPLPSEIIMPLSGWLLIRDQGLPVAYVLIAGFYGALGNAIGSAVAYVVGALGGRALVLRYGRYVLVSPHDLDLADRWFARYGDWAIFFSRLLPVVRTFISFPAGVARMNFARFILLSFAGSLPWSAALAYAGFQLGEHWERIREVMRPFDLPILVVILALVALYIFRHVRRIHIAAD